MSLLDKIGELQKKPEPYRKKVLAVLMVLIMSAVVFVWISTVNLSFGGTEAAAKKSGLEYAPFKILKEGAAGVKETFNDAVSQLKSAVK